MSCAATHDDHPKACGVQLTNAYQRSDDSLKSATFTLPLCLTGAEQTNASLHFHNDEHRSPVLLGKAFGHFSCSHPGLRIAKLIEDMQLTGADSRQCACPASCIVAAICALQRFVTSPCATTPHRTAPSVTFAACVPAQLAQAHHQCCFTASRGDNYNMDMPMPMHAHHLQHDKQQVRQAWYKIEGIRACCCAMTFLHLYAWTGCPYHVCMLHRSSNCTMT